MKITEPKTPYNYYNEEDDENPEVDLEQANPKLEKIKKKQDFEAKRKNHYNEYEMMKKYRENINKNLEDDDAEED